MTCLKRPLRLFAFALLLALLKLVNGQQKTTTRRYRTCVPKCWRA